MPKKTKKIQKAEKEEKAEAPAKKAGKKDANDWDIFSDSFKDRLKQFCQLNTEVTDLKSEMEGNDQSAQAEERKERMASKVEDAATAILKDELRALEEWIEEKQKNLKDDISRLQTAYENSRKALLDTGLYNEEEELKTQLSHIQKKADGKKEAYDNYDQLLAKSSAIYS